MIRRWLLFWTCLLLVLGSVTGALAARDQQAARTRGWENATETLDLPYRLPLAGVNAELTQYSADDLTVQLDRIQAAGFTWVRQPFLWQAIEPERGNYQWDTYDALVRAVAEHAGLELVAVLDGTPAWARDELAPEHPFAPPASVAEFAAFAGAVAARYADHVRYYQVWDEPNLKSHWGGLDPRPAHYVALLRGAYQAIHAADGDASVIAAALAPTVERGPDNLSDLLYLRAIYDLGGRDSFDAAAGKPYGFDHGPYDRRVDPNTLNFSHWILLREEMVRRGDGTKPLWGSNFGWNALPAGWTGPPSLWGSVTPDQQARYTRDAYRRAAQEWPWAGGLILQHWQPDAAPDDPQQGFAVAPVIESWLGQEGSFASEALLPGLYPADNPYAAYSEHWRLSALGADAEIPDPAAVTPETANQITVRFQGTAFAIPVRRDDYIAYLYLTVDGQPANALPRDRQGEAFILLTAPERRPELRLVRVAEDLADAPHTVQIIQRPYNGDDRWPIAGYAVASPADEDGYRRALAACGLIGGLALLGAGVTGLRLPWRRLKPLSLETAQRGMEWLAGLLASLLVLAGTILTWGEAIPGLLRRDPPALAVTILTAGIAALSPGFVLTLGALIVLFVLIYNRPLLGIMLVIFWSAFFLSTLDLLFHLFAVVEMMLGLTLAAVLARVVVNWGRERRGTAISTVVQRFRWTPLDSTALAWVGLGLLSLTWSEFKSPAVHQLRVIILEPAAFYFLLRLLRLERRDLLWLVDALLFTGGAIAVVGLVMFLTGQGVVDAEDGVRRLISVYGSPNGVGLYLGRCLPFALAFLLLPSGAWRRVYAGLSGGVMLLAVLLSQSRGAILLGLPAALIMMLLLWRGRRSLLPVVLAVVGMILVLVPLSLLLPRLSDLFGNTAFFRVNLWRSSISLIREHPITGVGLDQFLYWYRSRYLLPEAWAEPNLSIPHNLLLNHWVNLGLIGVLLGLLFQVLFWRTLGRTTQRARGGGRGDVLALALLIGLAGSMADFLAHGLVDVGYFSINLAFVFFLSLALVQHLRFQTNPLDQSADW